MLIAQILNRKQQYQAHVTEIYVLKVELTVNKDSLVSPF